MQTFDAGPQTEVIYEIINPSDSYTLAAADRRAAAVACLMLGGGQYGLQPIGDDSAPDVPLMLFWSAQDLSEWWTREFGEGTYQEYAAAHGADVADVLDSVMIGSANDRAAYFRALELIESEDSKREWREKWLDDRRSSLNNIGARAFALASRLRESVEPAS